MRWRQYPRATASRASTPATTSRRTDCACWRRAGACGLTLSAVPMRHGARGPRSGVALDGWHAFEHKPAEGARSGCRGKHESCDATAPNMADGVQRVRHDGAYDRSRRLPRSVRPCARKAFEAGMRSLASDRIARRGPRACHAITRRVRPARSGSTRRPSPRCSPAMMAARRLDPGKASRGRGRESAADLASSPGTSPRDNHVRGFRFRWIQRTPPSEPSRLACEERRGPSRTEQRC